MLRTQLNPPVIVKLCFVYSTLHENCAVLGYYAASSGNFFTDVSE